MVNVLMGKRVVWSKWLVSHWDVPYKGEVVMVFMILKLDVGTSND